MREMNKPRKIINVKTAKLCQLLGPIALCAVVSSGLSGGTHGMLSTCDSPIKVSLPASLDGSGEHCLETSGNITYVNSWNTQEVTINGVDYTNAWSDSMPERIDGSYYIHYIGNYNWSHLEVNGTGGDGIEEPEPNPDPEPDPNPPSLPEDEYQEMYEYFSALYKATYVGRFDFSNTDGPIFSWSTSTVKGNFFGTGISIALKRFNAWHDSAIAVVIDQNEYQKLTITSDGTYTLASNLEAAHHTIEVVKMDEGMSADIQFLGFTVENGEMLAPPQRSEKIIEIIGDSISVGYGIDSNDPNASWDSSYNNGYLAYGPLAARELGAEAFNISWSGAGMYRSYDESQEHVMPIYYWRTLSKDENLPWGFYQPLSDIIVINLHTNDFNPGIPNEDDFVGTFKNFIANIREYNPDAFIYCAVGPLVSGDKLIAARNYIQNGVVEDLKASGDSKIGFLEFSENDPTANGWGAGWHPSKKQHEVMANELVARIRADFAW